MSKGIEDAERIMALVVRVMVSFLWVAGGLIVASLGAPIVLLPVALYLLYLWVLGGRFLIY